MRTCSSISIAFSESCAESAWSCWRSTSSIWRPTLRIGLGAARGFWKIIDISRPRSARMSVSLAWPTSMPVNVTDPSAMRPARSRMRIAAYEVTDLPEPDSPTMPTVSPLATAMSTCWTARTVPRRGENSTGRARMSSRGVSVMGGPSQGPPRGRAGARPVAQKIEAEHRDHQRGAWKERDPPLARHHEGRTLRHHDPPFGSGRTHTKPDEREPRRIEDGVAHGERHLHHHDRHDVGQDLTQEDARVAIA